MCFLVILAATFHCPPAQSYLSLSSRPSIFFYTSAFWISYQVKEIISPSVLLTTQHFRRWTLWMPWKVNRGNIFPISSFAHHSSCMDLIPTICWKCLRSVVCAPACCCFFFLQNWILTLPLALLFGHEMFQALEWIFGTTNFFPPFCYRWCWARMGRNHHVNIQSKNYNWTILSNPRGQNPLPLVSFQLNLAIIKKLCASLTVSYYQLSYVN